MLRLASSTVFPSALRAIASSRILSGSITNAFSSAENSIEIPTFISHNFCTDAKKEVDRRLVKVLKSKIRWAKLLDLHKSGPATPADFPFTIENDPCERNITLTREFDGEKIDVLVAMPSNIPEDEEEDSDLSDTDTSDDDTNDNGGSDGDDDSSSIDSNSDEEDEKSLNLIVKISKLENGNKMEFEVSSSADNITIDRMSLMEPAGKSDSPLLRFGPHVVDVDSDLQIALREFLEIRGIKKTNFGFLYKYMLRKSKQHPVLALKKLTKFIKE